MEIRGRRRKAGTARFVHRRGYRQGEREKGINRGIILLCGMIASLFCGVILWCSATTFRAMSDWMLYAVNLTAAILLSLPSLLSRRVWPQIVMLVVVDALWLSNIMYCRTYFTAIPPGSYLLAGNLLDFTSSVTDSLRWGDICLPLITLMTIVYAYLTPSTRPWPRRSVCVYSTIAGIAVISIGLACRGGFYKSYDKLAQSCYYSTCGVPTYTIAGHLLYSGMSEQGGNPEESRAEIERWLKEKDATRPFTTLPDTARPRRNLVLIMLESFESWPIGKNAGGTEITPYINNLIKRADTFYAPQTLTQVASGRSIDAQLLIGSGLLPMQSAVYSMKYPNYTYPSLMKALKEDRGARSVILTCDKPITWNQEVISRAMGYDSLLHRSSWELDELIGNPAKLSDGSFLRQSVEKLQRDELKIGAAPYMLTFITYSGHNPFRLPDKLKDRTLSKGTVKYPERLRDYIQMAHYTDSQIGRLVEYLQSRPEGKETLIVITGDHEGLAGDRGRLHKSAPDLVSEGQYTPFIVLNSPIGGKIESVIGQIDIYPTLLAMLGLGSYGWHGIGENILGPREAPVAISSMTGIEEGDTTGVSRRAIENIREARGVSDKIISSGYRLAPEK